MHGEEMMDQWMHCKSSKSNGSKYSHAVAGWIKTFYLEIPCRLGEKFLLYCCECDNAETELASEAENCKFILPLRIKKSLHLVGNNGAFVMREP